MGVDAAATPPVPSSGPATPVADDVDMAVDVVPVDAALAPVDAALRFAGVITVAHEPYVHVDFDAAAACWVVTHTRTLERGHLPGPREAAYIVDFDPEGMAIVMDADERIIRLDEESFFSESLVVEPETGREMVETVGPESTKLHYYLDTREQLWKQQALILNVGLLRVEISVDAAVLVRPRAGCRLFFSLNKVYTELRFTMTNNASKWPSNSRRNFLKHLERVGFGAAQHIMRPASYAKESSEQEDEPEDLAGVAPFTAASSIALLALPVIWCTCTTKFGGFRDDRHREIAQSFAEQLIVSIVRGMRTHCALVLDDAAAWQWPRPIVGRACFELPVNEGLIDARALREAILASDMGGDTKAWAAGLEEAEAMSCFDVLRSLLKAKVHVLFMQLVAWLAKVFEQRWDTTEPNDRSRHLDDFGIEEDRDDAVIVQPKKRRRLLVEYYNRSLRYHEERPKAIGLVSATVDKAAVTGLGLQNMTIFYPDGVAIECFPQAGPDTTENTVLSVMRSVAMALRGHRVGH